MLECIKKILGSGNATLIISNDEMVDNQILKSLKILEKEVSETIQNGGK